MRLTRFGFEEHTDRSGEWRLEPFSLQQTNLIVGRNAVGKTRTLNVISGLARFILGGEASADGKFYAEFEHGGSTWTYDLAIDGGVVIDETLTRDGEPLLDRKKGEIWSEDYKKVTRFKMRENQIAVNAKLDLIQTPYLEPLNLWANSVYHFHFNSTLGKNTVTLPVPGATVPEVNLKDENQTAQIYKHAFEKYGEDFDKAVIEDMRSIGYDITEVGLGEMSSIRATNAQFANLHGMFVKENGVGNNVDQHVMSTGMFRALAIFIHLNLGIFSKHAELILLDDIGEGLDFERSTALIKVLISKIQRTDIQIIMTSNDRFIMNAVDVDYWTVLSRSLSSVRAFNKVSNPKAFEDFKFSGLQNFDFFSMELATETETE